MTGLDRSECRVRPGVVTAAGLASEMERETSPGPWGFEGVEIMRTLAIKAYVAAWLAREERGATAVEYGLIVALIAAVIIAVVATLGQDVLRGFQSVETQLT